MTETELRAWFKQLAASGQEIMANQSSRAGSSHEAQAAAWAAEAESALVAVFPAGHPCRLKWREAFEHIDRLKVGLRNHSAFPAALGVLNAALRILEADHLGSLLDGIRAETVSEVLDQAAALLQLKHHVAAAVLAGGALETHLLHLCDRNGLTPPGDGSISKYDGAIAQARNAGTFTIYSVSFAARQK